MDNKVERVTVVTVTYGNRWHLLEQTLQAAFTSGAVSAIVVDNASHDPVAANAAAAFPCKVTTLRLEANLGSAGGYCAGIRAALDSGAEYLLFLDDDNALEPEALAALRAAYIKLLPTSAPEKLCLLAYRPSHQRDLSGGISLNPLRKFAGGFLDFHLSDIPRKISQRLRSSNSKHHSAAQSAQSEFLRRQVAPYGGLFLHRSVILRYGLPNPALVLYQDDTEFSYRITSGGGAIWLVPAARIQDIEYSWSTKRPRSSAFAAWLESGSPLQIYYTARNKAYFERHCVRQSWTRRFNRAAFTFLLFSMALVKNRLSRYKLILGAVRDGEAGKLGIHPLFPLE